MKKIKINKLPKGFVRNADGSITQKMENGGQPILNGSPRSAANLEAEKGETVVTDLDNNRIPEHYKIGGKKHSQGGTPLNLPPKSFIFSDHKSMSIKGDALKKFIPGTSKKKMTPAQIASNKRFDISEENKILKDADADAMAKATAERNIQSKLVKLGELAMEQESIKDFENGIPEIAMPFLKRQGVSPEQVQMINAELEQKNMMDEMTAAYGKETYGYGGSKKKKSYYQTGSETNQIYAPDVASVFNKYGLSFDTSNIGATSYKDIQSFKGDGFYGGAEENIQGFKEVFSELYPDTEKLVASLGTLGKNVSNPEVKKFQEWYTNTYIPQQAQGIAAEIKSKRGTDVSAEDLKALEAGLKQEFGFGTGKKGFNMDGLMGTVTSSRRPLSYSIAAMEEIPAPEEIVPEELTPYTPEGQDTDFYLQDKLKVLNKATDRANRYFGYTQRLQPYLADPTFVDPERELQANEELGAINAQAMAQQGRGQNLGANLSLLQGKLAANQADTLARYTNTNAQISNQFDLYNTEAKNKIQAYNALQNRQQAIDTAVLNQQYDNFQRQKRNDLTNLVANAYTNRADTDLLNDLYPQYSIDPSTGGMGDFTGVGFVPGQDATAYDAFVSRYIDVATGGPRSIEESKEDKKKYGGSTLKLDALRKFMKG